MRRARHRLDAVERRVVVGPSGPIEFADRGAGAPVLVSHGIFHGCDGGLLSVRDLVHDRRVIAPSRLGYLGSALPSDAVVADQADAFAVLLDALDVDRADAIAVSAGATAALRFALHHRRRVRSLVIVSGNLPGGATAVAQPSWVRFLYADGPMWTLRTLAPPVMARLAGVPPGLPRSAEDDAFLDELLDSLFPVGPRADGIAFDAFVGNAEVNDYPLERVQVPTLLIHAQDDPLATYAAARRASERIPGAALCTLESGGHLALGQADRVHAAIDAFHRAVEADVPAAVGMG